MSIYAKIVGDNHNKYQYKLGLNLLQPGEEFNTKPVCCPGGLYFCDVKNIFEWLDHGDTVCIVEPEKGAPVVEVGTGSGLKYKTDRLVVKSMMSLSDVYTWKYLVENGASQYELLRCAAGEGHLEVVKYLVEKGADVRTDDDYPLRFAAGEGHLEVVKYLVENGANVHADNDYPLRLAAHEGHLEVVKYLVENGADVHICGDLALRWAVGKGYLEMVKYLETHR